MLANTIKFADEGRIVAARQNAREAPEFAIDIEDGASESNLPPDDARRYAASTVECVLITPVTLADLRRATAQDRVSCRRGRRMAGIESNCGAAVAHWPGRYKNDSTAA
ncbi:hypothetical protein [Burkholderia ambifaria]|uniref:hypothetical protein n=1 Tax=Burkholderia ambifaria TaxID=152480 RepID=UPI00030BF9EB|nr:hypothetical protein [Burkholderia ambifaria]